MKKLAKLSLACILSSAVVFADQSKNEGVRVEESNLYVKLVHVDGGRAMKRLQTAPQGRAYRIRKRSNHVTLVLDSKVKEEVETTSK